MIYYSRLCQQLLVFMLFFLAINVSIAQFKTSFYTNGKLKSEGCVSAKDSLKQGPWHFYFNTGKMNSEGSFYHGKQHGEWKYFNFDNGTVEKLETWKDGIQEGEMREFYPTGKLSRSIIFKNGVYDGASVSFHVNGKLKRKGLYKQGIPEGIWEEFDENGNLVVENPTDLPKEEKSRKRKKSGRRH
ncbi:MAG: toxin-antitoxin system YwqK family antitoxin [Cytophagales bacterium]